MSQVRIATAAKHFVSFEVKAPIFQVIDVFFGDGLFKARVPIACIVFISPFEKRQSACGTGIDPFALVIDILTQMSVFGGLIPHDVVAVLA
jgi:hypothetical protein